MPPPIASTASAYQLTVTFASLAASLCWVVAQRLAVEEVKVTMTWLGDAVDAIGC